MWEPLPGQCTGDQLSAHKFACGLVDVFSPNHLELLRMFDRPAAPFDAKVIEACAEALLDASTEQSTPLRGVRTRSIVVRAGEYGCLVTSAGRKTWLPPYFKDANRVIDATGGGNTFLGAFTIALQRTNDFVEAAIQGTVAASFAIQQIGLPRRTEKGSQELWNNERVDARMDQYRQILEQERLG